MCRPIVYLCDLDGTLLNKQAVIEPEVRKRLNRLIRRGLHITFITARDLESTIRILSGVQMNLPFAVCNGCLIVSPLNGEICKAWHHSYAAVQAILKAAEGISLPRVTRYNAQQVKGLLRQHLSRSLNDGSITQEYIFSVAFRDTADRIHEIRSRVMNLEDPSLFLQCYNDPFEEEIHILDITAASGNKGSAVRHISEILNIPVSHMVAIGDGENDLEMFRAAGAHCVVGDHPVVNRLYGDCKIIYDEGISVVDFIEQQFLSTSRTL
ncbi:HAD-IIB family hydrolase [Paenibacillus sp. FSL R7-0331]|uniref:HAD-IIB family hydrolase n=1 Tax=Paenibacillus sp. FSL R7-0331 TaxID=1536773 RepID=UPI0004F5D6A1|nr:HAD family hydrolase [Paenibacillus sp. FSL R7-0331]AIQ51303.1 hypothetical protein R70331_07120 [Paenibacillus sp. FSL R7-0331]